MTKIIVAEDEYFARKVLVKMLKELGNGIEICGEAETGLEVLELMEMQNVDIVITDIRMPDMDGLALAEQISEKYPDTAVIIETGFAEFDYAMRAIKYGVKDYLTKPVKREELEHAIRQIEESKKKVIQTIEAEIYARRAQYMDFTYVLENADLSERILGGIFKKIETDSWYLCVVQSREKGLNEQQIHTILEILEKPEGDTQIQAAFFYPKEEFVFVLNPVKGEREFPTAVLKKKLVSCQNHAKADLEIGISLCQSQTDSPQKEVSSVYREAVYAINQRLLSPGKQFYFYEQEVSILPYFTQAEERNLEHFCAEGKIKEAEHLLESFFAKCTEKEQSSSYSLFFSLVQIINVMNRVYNQKQEKLQQGQESSMLFSFKTDLYIYRTLDEIKRYIFQILRDVCGVEEQKSSIVADLLKYLEWNYQYDITVNELAMHKYFVNPSYLSRLFKAETGKPFSRYLIELRMKNAGQMLNNSDLKVSDVAICVGYNDVSYFIQTFKKHYGVTPEQYKKNTI